VRGAEAERVTRAVGEVAAVVEGERDREGEGVEEGDTMRGVGVASVEGDTLTEKLGEPDEEGVPPPPTGPEGELEGVIREVTESTVEGEVSEDTVGVEVRGALPVAGCTDLVTVTLKDAPPAGPDEAEMVGEEL